MCKGKQDISYFCGRRIWLPVLSMSKPKISRLEKSFVSDSTHTFHFSPEPRYWLGEEADDHAPRA